MNLGIKCQKSLTYYEGKQQANIWLVSTEDLKMYSNYLKGDITLCCGGGNIAIQNITLHTITYVQALMNVTHTVIELG